MSRTNRMTRVLLIGSSSCGCDEAARRLKACSQISVIAYFTEPSWQVALDPIEERVELTIGDRSYGDTDSGDEDVMTLYFRTPSTVYDMGVALMESSERLDQILDAQPPDAVSVEPVRDSEAAPSNPEPGEAGTGEPTEASDGAGLRGS
jgi:hypothetical protein